MPPRLQLSSQEAARLPGLLALRPTTRIPFDACQSHLHRVLWVLDAYGVDPPSLTPNLCTLLIFEQGLNLARSTVEAALEQALAAGVVEQGRDGHTITKDGRQRLQSLRAGKA
jgi:hypothetical protein